MPAVAQSLNDNGAARIMIYGAPGTRKTWWALNAAQFGFHVILADLDGKFQIARQLDAATQSRIYHLDMRPTGDYKLSGAATLAMAAQGSAVYFDEEAREFVPANKIVADRTYTKLHLQAGGLSTVLVIDSWAAFIQQIAAINVPVRDATTVSKLEWDDYQKVRLAADLFIANLKRLNCHLIVTGHDETYARKRPDADSKAPLKDQIEAVRVQPSSITRAHGETMARMFNDVLHFEIPSTMVGTMIDTAGSENFDALTQSVKPGRYKWDNLQFDQFVAPGILNAVANSGPFSSPMVVPMLGADILAARSANASASVNVPAGGTVLSNLAGLGKK